MDLIKMTENHPNLIHHDQTVINYVLYPYIGLLPIKFGIFNFQSVSDIKERYFKLTYFFKNRIINKTKN